MMKMAVRKIWNDVKKYKWIAVAFLLYNIVVMNAAGAFCPLVIMTGIPCPGCGMTRALFCVLMGRFAEAFRYNACIYLWVPLGIWVTWNRYVKDRKTQKLVSLLTIVGVIMIIWHIYRMIVYYPGEPPLVFFENNMAGKILSFYNEMICSLSE